jgi:hypothetical protein
MARCTYKHAFAGRRLDSAWREMHTVPELDAGVRAARDGELRMRGQKIRSVADLRLRIGAHGRPYVRMTRRA